MVNLIPVGLLFKDDNGKELPASDFDPERYGSHARLIFWNPEAERHAKNLNLAVSCLFIRDKIGTVFIKYIEIHNLTVIDPPNERSFIAEIELAENTDYDGANQRIESAVQHYIGGELR